MKRKYSYRKFKGIGLASAVIGFTLLSSPVYANSAPAGGGGVTAEIKENRDFNVSLANIPSDGYDYNAAARMKIHITNTTGKDLNNLKIRFKIKKRLVDPGDTSTPDERIAHNIPYFMNILDHRYTTTDTVVFVSDDLYLMQNLRMRSIQQGSSLDTFVNLNLLSLHRRLDPTLNISNEFATIKDFDLDYDIINESDVLGSGTMRIKLKPSHQTIDRSFALQLTKKLPSDRYTFSMFLNSQSTKKFKIAGKDDRKFWLAVTDTSFISSDNYHSYLDDSTFKFLLPDGVRLDEETLRRVYKGMDYRIDGKTVTVNVRPKDVGLNLKDKGFTGIAGQNIYFALPVIIDVLNKDTYHFDVDTVHGQFGRVTPLDITKLNFEEVSIPKLFKFEDHHGYRYVSGLASKFSVSSMTVTRPTGYDYNLHSIDINTKTRGATLKSVVFHQFGSNNARLKMYGITLSGDKRELITTTYNSKLHWSDLVPTAYNGVFQFGNTRVDIPDDVVTLRAEWMGDDINAINTDNIYALWDVIDETELLGQGKYSAITYHTDKGDVSYEPKVRRETVDSRWMNNPLDVTITQTSGTTFLYRNDNNTLLNYDVSDVKSHVILKVPKDLVVDTVGYSDPDFKPYAIIKEEIVGDVKYVLLEQQEGSKIWNTNTTIQYSVPSIFKDGVYNIAMRDYLSGVIGNPKLNGLQFTGNMSFQYDPNKSLKDNFETVTDGSIVTKKLTVNTSKALSTTTLVNGRKKITLGGRNDIAEVKSYLVNKSNDVIKNPVLMVDVPENLELTGPVIAPSGNSVQYQLNGEQGYVDSVTDYSQVKRYRVISNADLQPTENIEVIAHVRLKSNITSNINATMNTTATHNDGRLVSGNVTITSDLQEFKDGTVNVTWIDENGTTLKTQTLTGRHGTNYNVDTTITKDGKHYEVVSGETTGTYVGGETNNITIRMRERALTFDLPTTGTADMTITLAGLAGALVITKRKKPSK